jgi:hypothetical protein
MMAVFVGSFLALLTLTAHATNVVTAFGPALLPNAAGPNMFGSAQIEVSIFQTTPNGGIVDFALTNTSARILLQPGEYANAFVTVLQFDLPDHYVPIYNQCQLLALVGVRFANGAGNPVVTTTLMRVLNWTFELGTGGGLYARANEADEQQNYNAIFSANALNTSGVPVENYANGFLKSAYDYGVFDTVIFRVKFENDGPITEGDLPFFSNNHLTVKFQGGNGSVWTPNQGIIPEPASFALLLPGLLAFIPRLVKRAYKR